MIKSNIKPDITEIDGALLKNMIIAGANTLNLNRDIIDALNVFPVPDGDTGINMAMTTLAAAKEAEAVDGSVSDVARAASGGSLRGARGNSGVILSQLFRGFARGLEDCKTATTTDIAHAFKKAVDTAYKAVMKPKEGTILTVAKEMANEAADLALDTDEIIPFFREVLKTGNAVLARTTEMLPALKQANVVDAGGQGLLCILEGAFAVLTGKDADYTVKASLPDADKIDYTVLSTIHDEDIEFTYCTEFFINITEKPDNDKADAIETELKTFLDSMGDSIVVVCDEDIIKIHVHTNNPGKVLEKALTIGSLSNIKIENMRIQHTEKISFIADAKENRSNVGFVVVSTGSGFKELFESLGANIVIEGGQTMNPSTDDILRAIERVNAHNVFVLPNNKNIILAAQQASSLAKDRRVVVLPSKSIPQGVTALIGYSETASVDENVDAMTEMMDYVHCGQITYAVRNTVFDGNEIKEGDILCMYDGDIALVSDSINSGAKQLISKMMDAGGEIMTIYYGADTTHEQAEALAQEMRKKYADCEVELQNGGQPIYYYIISVE